jgi:hypothetical protein
MSNRPTERRALRRCSRMISKQIDYPGKMPMVTPKPVRTSEKAKDMLRFISTMKMRR